MKVLIVILLLALAVWASDPQLPNVLYIRHEVDSMLMSLQKEVA